MNQHCRISKATDKKTGRQLIIFPSNKFLKNDTTSLLEEALLMARQGEFVAVGIIGVMGDGQIGTSYTNGAGYNWGLEVVAGAEFLKDRIMRDMDKPRGAS